MKPLSTVIEVFKNKVLAYNYPRVERHQFIPWKDISCDKKFLGIIYTLLCSFDKENNRAKFKNENEKQKQPKLYLRALTNPANDGLTAKPLNMR